MGYTNYELITNISDSDEYIDIIDKLRAYSLSAERAINQYGDTYEEVKWYEHEEELKEFSKLYPKILFALYGHGEDVDDIWVKYFIDGKMQSEKAEIVYPRFNPQALKG